MGTLRFVCPANGRDVDTGIEVDPDSFNGLYRERVGCSECHGNHELLEIKAWVGDKPPDPAGSESLSAAPVSSSRSI